MTIIIGEFLMGIPAHVPFAKGVNLDPAGGRLSTSSLMGSESIKGNIAAAGELAKGGSKWEVIGIDASVDRAEDSLVNLGQSGLYGEGKTQFSRYALTLRSELSGGLFLDKTLYFTGELGAESVLAEWPQISASDVDESKLKNYGNAGALDVYEAGVTIAAADHLIVDEVTCAGTLGGTSPRSDMVARYAAASSDWAAGYSLSNDGFALLGTSAFATTFVAGDGIFQAAAGQDTTTGERIGTVIKVYDAQYGIKWSADF